ncbi:MAG: hypothetical protein HZA36_02240 [Parcubacteria group bacterium]|nr:hypothetical protein [Parcubacteria group bacterium]
MVEVPKGIEKKESVADKVFNAIAKWLKKLEEKGNDKNDQEVQNEKKEAQEALRDHKNGSYGEVDLDESNENDRDFADATEIGPDVNVVRVRGGVEGPLTQEERKTQRNINRYREYLGSNEEMGGDVEDSEFREKFSKEKTQEVLDKIRESEGYKKSYENATDDQKKEIQKRVEDLRRDAQRTEKELDSGNIGTVIDDRALIGSLSDEQFVQVMARVRPESKKEYEDAQKSGGAALGDYIANAKDKYQNIASEKGEVRDALQKAWKKSLLKDAINRVEELKKPKNSKEALKVEQRLQQLAAERLKEGKCPDGKVSEEEIKNEVSAKRVELMAEVLEQEKKDQIKEELFAEKQGQLKAREFILNNINKPNVNLVKLMASSEVVAFNSKNKILEAREARRNGLDVVYLKPADPEVVVPPVDPTGPETPPGTPPTGPRGQEGGEVGTSPEGVEGLRSGYELAMQAYISTRYQARLRSDLGGGALEINRRNFEQAREAHIAVGMGQYAEAGRKALGEIDVKIANLRKEFEAAGGPSVKEGENQKLDALRAGLGALLNERTEMLRSQKNALTEIGITLNTQLSRQFHERELAHEKIQESKEGTMAKANRWFMQSTFGRRLKVYGGVGLTALGVATANPFLAAAGGGMLATSLGWETGRMFGRNKNVSAEQAIKMTPDQINKKLESLYELRRREGKSPTDETYDRFETIRILEEQKAGNLEKAIGSVEGSRTPEGMARILTNILQEDTHQRLTTAEDVDKRSGIYNWVRRAGGIAAGATMGLIANAGTAFVGLFESDKLFPPHIAIANGHGGWDYVKWGKGLVHLTHGTPVGRIF